MNNHAPYTPIMVDVKTTLTENEVRYHNAALAEENGRLRAVLLNIQSVAERGFPIDNTKLAARCRNALGGVQQQGGTSK
jgi:hypothetical protein